MSHSRDKGSKKDRKKPKKGKKGVPPPKKK
jgi:hypothetical protein